MYSLDSLLAYLIFITMITFIFERIIENLLIPFFPFEQFEVKGAITSQQKVRAETAVSGANAKKKRTFLTLSLMYGLGLILALSDLRFRLFAGGLKTMIHPIADILLSAALIAGGSQPLHSVVQKIREK